MNNLLEKLKSFTFAFPIGVGFGLLAILFAVIHDTCSDMIFVALVGNMSVTMLVIMAIIMVYNMVNIQP